MEENGMNRVYKVILIGDSGVGKTSLLMRLCKNEFKSSMTATLGVDSHTKTITVDEKPITIQVWDTAGQERFRSIAKSYFRRADGVLLLYDCTYENSFINVRDWMSAVVEGAGRPLPTMLCGNKFDMRETSARYGKKCVSTEQGKKLAASTKSHFIETSAKLGTNVSECLDELAKLLLKAEDDEKRELAFQLTGEHPVENTPRTCCSGGKTST
ncbi:ras and EF-hand domain-containing protein homolog [Ciona intestinalis]